MYWQGAVYFPLVDHIVQKLNDRPLWQENRFIGQYIVPAKLNSFNSGVQDKLYETYKTDLSVQQEQQASVEEHQSPKNVLCQHFSCLRA